MFAKIKKEKIQSYYAMDDNVDNRSEENFDGEDENEEESCTKIDRISKHFLSKVFYLFGAAKRLCFLSM